MTTGDMTTWTYHQNFLERPYESSIYGSEMLPTVVFLMSGIIVNIVEESKYGRKGKLRTDTLYDRYLA